MIGVGNAREADPAVRPWDDDARDALAVLVSVQGVGPLTLARLVEAFGTPMAVLEAATGPSPVRALATAGADAAGRSMAEKVAAAIVDASRNRDAILRSIATLGLRVLLESDREYPDRLRTIDLPPPVLFVRGDPSALNVPDVVAVVGTRRPTDSGRRIASRIAASLARAGAAVVSGLAIGIDGAAHAACLEAGGPTVAIIGGGHGRLFPTMHDRLAGAIVDAGGAVVSEYPPDTEPTKGTFPRRNRLISGASDAVIVVEAGARSGAILTANWALEQGRECFVVPGSIDAPASAGCLGFLRDWSGVARIVAGVPQLLDDLGLPATAAFGAPVVPASTRPGRPSASVRHASAAATLLVDGEPSERTIAGEILRGAATVDELMAVTHLPVGVVLGALTRLEARGLVEDRSGHYRAIGSLAAAELPPAA